MSDPNRRLTQAQTQTPRPRRRRWLRWLIALVLLCATLVGASFAARSEWFLRRRIDPKLQELGERFGGTFSYVQVSPIGWTGVAVRGLVFTPDPFAQGEAQPSSLPSPLRVAEIAVYPDLQALILGEIVPHRVELSGVQVEVWLDDAQGGRGHWPWLEAAVARWQQPGGGLGGAGQSSASARAQRAAFPEVLIHDGEVALRSPAGSMPEVAMRLDSLRIAKDGGQFFVDGGIALEGAGYALLSADADLRGASGGMSIQWMDSEHNLLKLPGAEGEMSRYIKQLGDQSRLSLRSAELTWPPSLILHGPALDDTRLRIPGQDAAYIESLRAERVEVSFQGDLVQLRVIDLDVQAKMQWMNSSLSASLPMSLPTLDIGLDFMRRRVGLAFEVDHPTRGWLRAAGAYDIRARDLAFSLQARRFDAGAMLSLIPYAGPISAEAGLLDGQLTIRYLLGDGLLRIDSDLGVLDAAVTAPWLSDQPLTDLDLHLKAAALLDLQQQTLSISEGVLSIGALPLTVSGHIRRLGARRHVYMDLHLQARDLPSEALLDSLPEGFAPTLEGYALTGPFSFSIDLAVDTQHPEQMVLEPTLNMKAVSVTQHGSRANIPLLASNDFSIRVNTASPPLIIGPRLPQWTPLASIPDALVKSLLSAEDSRFFQHRGFDLKAIQASLIANMEAGHVVRGGSTITQQLAKNLFLSQRKTVARKLQESFLTWQLEQNLSKRRILELYLNMVHWGPGVYGVAAAARHYFNLKPSQLSLRESIFLTAILPNPNRFGEHYAQGFIQADRLQKMQNILVGLRHLRFITPEAFQTERALLAKAQISKRPRPAPAAEGAAAPSPQARLAPREGPAKAAEARAE
jgi:monofunctional biosynthetic peptidoglycan transglycosylase